MKLRRVLGAALFVAAAHHAASAGIATTRHNLSVSGLFSVKSSTEDQLCVFCHTPHNPDAAKRTLALWNHSLQTSTYTAYNSTTLDAAPGQPDGTSKLCLSCHDGTVALGSVYNANAQPTVFPGLTSPMAAGVRMLGTDLTNDHPVSIVPNLADSEIQLPPAGDPVKLDAAGKVQCSSCHDPHKDTYPKFLRKDPIAGALCLTCHPKAGWTGSMHQSATNVYPPTGETVAQRACMSCHTPHNASSPTRLLRANTEEGVCYDCHKAAASGGIGPDIQTEFAKANKMNLTQQTWQHQPMFTSPLLPEAVLLNQKHVECTDCHNPHRVRARGSVPPGNQGNVHNGMRGINLAGSIVDDTAGAGGTLQQYQVCLRCHGDTFGTFIPSAATRPPAGSNKRIEFDTANESFHPVGATGKNQSVVLNSFAAGGQMLGNDWQGNPLSKTSTVKCSDCHNNNLTSNVNGSADNSGSGPKGPHGSTNARILRANYTTSTAAQGTFNAANFTLCFLCHSQTRLMNNNTRYTNFWQNTFGSSRGNLHWLHLQDRDEATCHNCHYNVHSNVQAGNTEFVNLPAGIGRHLVNFAPNVTAHSGTDPNTGSAYTKPAWGRRANAEGSGTFRYYCFLNCHGGDMDGTNTMYDATDPQP